MKGSMLDRIEVATPCPMRWDDLEGDDAVRFCEACRLNVYDFSGMSRKEAESLILDTEGRICGRFFRRSDGTVITRDCPVGLAAVRRRVMAFASGVAALLALMLGVFGWRAVEARSGSGGKLLPVVQNPQAPAVEFLGDVCVPEERLGRIAAPAPPPTPVK